MINIIVFWGSGKEYIDLGSIESKFLSGNSGQINTIDTYEIRANPPNRFQGRCNYQPVLSFLNQTSEPLTSFSLEYQDGGTFQDSSQGDGLVGTATYTLVNGTWNCQWLAKTGGLTSNPKCETKNHTESRSSSISQTPGRDPHFRETILASDSFACVITGEIQDESLDAAHIHEVNQMGFDTDNNGIILRKDLHALFDLHLFTFKLDGSVEFGKGLSDSYAKTLEGKKLSKKTLARVQGNLEKRYQTLKV